MLLTINDFDNVAMIPMLSPADETTDPSYGALRSEIESYIEKYEPLFARKFFRDKELYSTLLEYDTSTVANSDLYDSLIKHLRMSLSHYVSFMYHRSRIVTPIGGVELQSEHGKRTSLIDVQVELWNQMVDNNLFIYADILGMEHPNSEVFVKINNFNL